MASGAESSSSSVVLDQQINNHSVAAGPSYPEADDVVEVSAETLQSTERYFCDVCFKGYARVQNLIFHLKVHKLHYSIKSTVPGVSKRVYVCPEPTCPRHKRALALGDFGALKKHYLIKHSTEKKYKCNTCSKEYAVKIDLKAHLKVCGKKRYVSHCGDGLSRLYNLDVHQEAFVEPEHGGAAEDTPALHIGDNSVNATFNNNNNNNNSTFIGLNASHLTPHNLALQNPSAYFPSFAPYKQSHFYPSGADNWSPVTHDPSTALKLGKIIPDHSFTSSIQQNQHELQEGSNLRVYANLLQDRVQSDYVDHDFERVMRDGGNIYGKWNGSNSHSSYATLTPDVHYASLNQMLDPVSGVGPSTFNQQVGASNDHQGSYYCYSDGGGNFDYGGGTEAVNFETSTETAKVLAPYEQHLNKFRGFWF